IGVLPMAKQGKHQTVTIQAEARAVSGKGIARKLRVAGKIPGVLYGAGKDPVKLSVVTHSINMAMQAGGFYTHAHSLMLDGKETKVLARSVQRHPVSENLEHIDFMYFVASSMVTVTVPVRVEGEMDSPGLKSGGVLQLVEAELELVCRADSIPEEIVISVAALDVGDSIHMSNITLPAGVRSAIVDRDVTIVSVVSTRTSTMDALDAAPVGDAAAPAAVPSEKGAAVAGEGGTPNTEAKGTKDGKKDAKPAAKK
ncbi:MAG: 50S ribosomal protein L25/general stress protein Ctc, partial [Alphaproteobacteria bacterium]